MSDSDYILETTDVLKSYAIGQRTLEVLKGVSLSVVKGEMLALKGASGAGKSTLLHLMGGLDTADGGSVCYNQKPLDRFTSDQMYDYRNKKVGFVFQAYHLLPELDALENVVMPARIGRVPGDEAREKAVNLLERVGLKQRMTHRPTELSGGEQQRVSIARALIQSPDVLLADEPTGNLDTKTGSEIISLLQEICRESGTTLVVATHDDKVAEAVPRVVELIDGLVACG